MYDAVIIGGGAAGLMAGGLLVRMGKRVAIVEKKKPAGKILITGKGRCNLTNNCTADAFMANIVSNGRFMYSSYNGFTAADTMDFFESLGVKLKTERGARVFPVSDSSAEVAAALIGYASGCNMVKGEVKDIIVENGRAVGVRISGGRDITAGAVLLAAGGASYPGTGSDGAGFRLAAAAGHNVVKPAPALCGINLSDNYLKDLQGLSLKNVRLTLESNKKKVFSEMGEMEFTHFGISGPIVLTLSSLANRLDLSASRLYIDFKPALTPEMLDRRLLREFSEAQNRDLKNVLCTLLPKALAPIVADRAGGDCKVHSVTAAGRAAVAEALKCFVLNPTSLRPVSEGIVTAGGVDTKQIDPKTMHSKLVKGLFFAGEVIDVDALTGGFNLQVAFSTGRAAARGIESYTEGE